MGDGLHGLLHTLLPNVSEYILQALKPRYSIPYLIVSSYDKYFSLCKYVMLAGLKCSRKNYTFYPLSSR